MARRSAVTLLATAAALVVAGGLDAASAHPAYKLTRMSATLFYADSGTFSLDIPKDAPLWNTIIGEGWAKQNSDATLIRVTVSGTRGSYAPGRAVRLNVRKGRATASGFRWGAVVLRRTQRLGVLSETGKTVAAIWLYDTGCIPVLVTAKLVGQSRPTQLDHVIPFACGE